MMFTYGYVEEFADFERKHLLPALIAKYVNTAFISQICQTDATTMVTINLLLIHHVSRWRYMRGSRDAGVEGARRFTNNQLSGVSWVALIKITT